MLTFQEFLARNIETTASELVEAFQRLPQDKRDWQPQPTSRAASDLVAECAILNGQTADNIVDQKFTEDFTLERLEDAKKQLAQDEAQMLALLHENTAKAVAVVRSVADADLEVEIQLPWRTMTVSDLMAYIYWNMKYHTGQINYIASLLDCLK